MQKKGRNYPTAIYFYFHGSAAGSLHDKMKIILIGDIYA